MATSGASPNAIKALSTLPSSWNIDYMNKLATDVRNATTPTIGGTQTQFGSIIDPQERNDAMIYNQVRNLGVPLNQVDSNLISNAATPNTIAPITGTTSVSTPMPIIPSSTLMSPTGQPIAMTNSINPTNITPSNIAQNINPYLSNKPTETLNQAPSIMNNPTATNRKLNTFGGVQ